MSESKPQNLLIYVVGAILVAVVAAFFLVESFQQKVKAAAAKVGIGPATSTSKSTTSTGVTQTTSSGGGGTSAGTTAKNVNVVVKATDSSDAYARDWMIFDTSPGPYKGSGNYQASPKADEQHTSGDTMNVTISTASGSAWLAITQAGGSNFGQYSGTITVNGNSIPFTGVDADHPFQFSLS